MAYKLTSEDLVEYLTSRLNNPEYQFHALKSQDRGVIVSLLRRGKKYSASLVPTFVKDYPDRIELEVEVNRPGKGPESFNAFLKEFVDKDIIFRKPSRLYSPEREKELPSWRGVLKRVPSEGKMVCEIIDSNVSTERLKKFFYEYMVRISLVHVIHE